VSAVATTETEIMPAVPAATVEAAVVAGDASQATEDAGQPAPRPPAVSAAPPVSAAPQSAAASPPPVPPEDVVRAAVAEPLEALARTLGTPCGVALLRLDGAVLAQCWQGLSELPAGTYMHLASAAQAAARALLLADLGSLEDACIRTSEHTLLLRRVARGERATMLVAMLPRAADMEAAATTLHVYAKNLEPVLR
jgi:hypothetical protein